MRKICCVFVWLALPLMALGQTTNPPTHSPFTTKGAFFALSVADLGASASWYKEKLGMNVVMELKQEKVAVTVLEGSGLIVELIQNADALPLRKAAPSIKDAFSIHGLVKAGIIVDDFEGTMAMLKERQVEIFLGPYPAKGNQRANVIFKDNAGNLIQFFGNKVGSSQ